jgi:putative membrane protein
MILGLSITRGHTPGVIELLRSALGGFLMGAADLVPGVSGGTIALVIGIYERLVASIREGSSALGSLLKADGKAFREHFTRVEWELLIPLLAGILIAVVTLSQLLEHQLETNPTIMAGAFLGLVVGSVVIAWRLIRNPEPRHFAIALIVGLALFLLLGLGQESSIADPSLLAYLGAGALAICAMILPGISGSLILLLIGMYSAVLGAVNDRDFVSIGVFVIGAVVGLAIFSQVLYWALRNHHDVVLAALVGLMIGSIRVLWPWPGGVDSSGLSGPEGDVLQVTVAALIGLGFVFVVARLARNETEVSEPQPIG